MYAIGVALRKILYMATMSGLTKKSQFFKVFLISTHQIEWTDSPDITKAFGRPNSAFAPETIKQKKSAQNHFGRPDPGG